ncbi:MAG: sigma-70 family RNA polymerase sigma factor [Actinomycetota bacterium]
MLTDRGRQAESDGGDESDAWSPSDDAEDTATDGETAELPRRTKSPTHPSNAIAGQLAAGDPTSFEELYDLMSDRLFRVALRMLDDFHEAQDAVQQAFLELARTDNRPTDGSSLEAWLFTSVRFNCLDTRRYRGRRPSIPFSQVPERRGDVPDYDLGFDPQLEAALKLLTPDQRLVLHLKHVEELDGNQIAEIMDSSRTAVYAMAARAERRVRHYLEHSSRTKRS